MKAKTKLTKKQHALSIKSLNNAILMMGDVLTLAKKLNVTRQIIYFWRNGTYIIPINRAIQIESITEGAISAKDIRPDLVPKIRAPRIKTDESK